MRDRSRVVVAAACCVLAACGGSGGSDASSEPAAETGDLGTSTSTASTASTSPTSAAPTSVPPTSAEPPTTPAPTTAAPTTAAPTLRAATTAEDGSTAPSAVAATANAILAAARADDYAALSELASTPGFTYSFGDGGGDPGEFWRSTPGSTATLLEILTRPPARDTLSSPATWVWPGAWVFASEEDDAAYGPRLGIAEDGTWEWYVLGGD